MSDKYDWYVIGPVRKAQPERTAFIRHWVRRRQAQGERVFWSAEDVEQDDATGIGICQAERIALGRSRRVAVFWDVTSKGSHFDLGMAYAFGIPVSIICQFEPDVPGKSYVKVMLGDMASDEALRDFEAGETGEVHHRDTESQRKDRNVE